MGRKIFTATMLFVLLSIQPGVAQQDTHQTPVSDDVFLYIADNIVSPFFTSLKAGDVNALKRYIGPEMYESRRILIEENKGYPEFLRNYYQGVSFEIQRMYWDSNRYIVVEMRIEFPDEAEMFSKLYLWNFPSDSPQISGPAGWRIVEFHYQ